MDIWPALAWHVYHLSTEDLELLQRVVLMQRAGMTTALVSSLLPILLFLHMSTSVEGQRRNLQRVRILLSDPQIEGK